MTAGKVWLVGVGPGDAELMTLKAARVLAAADVWLVDDLVGHDVLALAAPAARVLRVGKRGGCRSTPQSFINRLLLRHARQGRSVARVKGGDAMLFGRGGEEAAWLRAAGVDVEVVNGLTSGMLAATAIDVPLTHRDCCRGVAFVTAHAQDGGEPNWPALAQSGLTLAIYMGMQRLDRIRDGLIAGGMPATTPVAVVQSASTQDERRLLTTLAQLPAQARASGMASPAIVLVGQVVGLSPGMLAEAEQHAA